jgi:hypothetical protein
MTRGTVNQRRSCDVDSWVQAAAEMLRVRTDVTRHAGRGSGAHVGRSHPLWARVMADPNYRSGGSVNSMGAERSVR